MKGGIKALFTSLLVLLAAMRLYAAPGDIAAMQIETNGWQLIVTFEGMGAGGKYFPGIPAPFYHPVNPGIVVTLKSMGFDAEGKPILIDRTLYGTRQLRLPYPNQKRNDETIVNGTDLQVRFALSDWVYQKDTNIFAVIQEGLYFQGNRLSTRVSGAPVNASLKQYPKPIGNWSRPPLERVTNDVAVVAMIGFGHHADDGKPLQCVAFWAEDEHGGRSPTNLVSHAVIDAAYGDATPVIEYVGNLDISGLTQGDLLTCHFAAFPRVGDAEAILSTADGRFAFPSHETAPTKILCDRLSSYGAAVAVVATDGSDAAGQAVYEAEFSAESPPPAFATMSMAVMAMLAKNGNTFGRFDAGGGILYLKPGHYNYAGGNLLLPQTSRTWVTVTPFPGQGRDSVVITNATGAKSLGNKVKLENVTISSRSRSGTFEKAGFMWFDRCAFVGNADTRLIDLVTNVYMTRCLVSSLPQGANAASVSDENWRITRGNDFTDYDGSWFPNVFIGNYRGGQTNGAFKCFWVDSRASEHPSYPIIAFNRFMAENLALGGDVIALCPPDSIMKNTNGLAVVQNVVEFINGGINVPRCMSLASSKAIADDTNDCQHAIVWHNTMVGQRVNLLENAGGKVVAKRDGASVMNNMFDQPNTKNDTHYNSDGIRVGNWPVSYGVNWSGNIDLDPQNMDSGTWFWDFMGLYSKPGTNNFVPTIFYWPGFANRQAGILDGKIAKGNGDYHLDAGSPLIGFGMRQVLPYDIEGVPRLGGVDVGAYAYRRELVTAIEIYSLSIQDNHGFLEWSAIPHRIYRLEYKRSLDDPEWKVLVDNMVSAYPTGQADFFTPPGASQCYFRVTAQHSP